MMSFGKALRGKQPRGRTSVNTSDVSQPLSTHKQSEENQNVIVGYEQGSSIPYTADRKSAMRLLTRHGKILDSNPYRLPGIPDVTELEETRKTKDDSEIVYRSDALDPISDEAIAHSVSAVPGHVQEDRATPYLDEDSVARLDGIELFPPDDDDWEYCNGENIPVSRFSPWDSEASPKKKGIFRSLSQKVKGSLRRSAAPARPEISAPLLDLRHEPEGPSGLPNVMEYALSIEHPAPELANRAGSVAEAIGIRRQTTNKLATKPPQSNHQLHREQSVPPSRPTRPRRVKVVGEEDRMTELGDFIDAGLEDSSSGELIEDDDSYDEERRILKIRSLHPLRKPSKKVDTSKYNWMPPVPPILPTPAKVTSAHDWRMSDEYPSVDSLFDAIEQQIADIGGAKNETPAGRRGANHLRPTVDHPLPGTGRVDDEDEEQEVMVDTFIHGDHTLWVASERCNEITVRSSRREFRQDRQGGRDEGDEIATLVARLRTLR